MPVQPSLRPVALGLLLLAAGAATAAAPAVSLVEAPDGVPLCVAEAGNPQGPPLLLIHGFAQSHAVFAPQFAGALAREFRLIAPDMRGHGCSGKPWTEAAYAGARPWADDLAAVLRARQVTRPVVIVGWSAGGYWMLDYVRERGVAAVAGLVFAGSHGGMVTADIDPGLPGKLAQARAANASYPLGIDEALARAERFPQLMAARQLPPEMARVMSASTLMLPAYARRAMAARDMDNADLAPRLAVPVLFIVGDADPIAPQAQVEAAAGRVPGAEAHVYPGAGHATFAEQPERFDRDVAEFARRAYATAARVRP